MNSSVSSRLLRFTAEAGACAEQDLQAKVLDELGRVVPGKAAGAYLLRSVGNAASSVQAYGVGDYFLAKYEHQGRDSDLVLEAVLTSRSAVTEAEIYEPAEWMLLPLYRQVLALHSIAHTLQAPLIVAGEVRGTLNVARTSDQGAFAVGELAVVEALGRLSGLAMESARIAEEIGRRLARASAALDLIDEPVVVTDIRTAERTANAAAQRIIGGFSDGRTFDDLLARSRDGAAKAPEGTMRPCEDPETGLKLRSTQLPDDILITIMHTPAEAPTHARALIQEALSPREYEIADLVASGLRDGQIAEQLFLSPHTVKKYLKSTYRKLSLRSRVELTRAMHGGA
ncbi:DNA-binding NarL/FixJ family response regulator [Streptomyces achromogenes]|uniref:DNA-binding NarL/FixJ family response regulator n=1 Tax=Streptomyces achromogenes TaxID=67255 RepID=A0ABU0PVC2_STRAH|nr:LuxR C-terminal-related transcriptional regulator [Streptomyces achromogenes]MDQ0681911.1 DNA-binding NarL/FixJ family response regulator [Streptomyces achromogenes]